MSTSRRGFAFASYIVDPVRRLVWQDRRLLPIEGKPFEILVFLVEHRDRIVEKDELLKSIWPDTFVQENNLVRHISTLRKALGQRPDDHTCIVTVKGRGYQFVADVRELDSLPAGLTTLIAGQSESLPRPDAEVHSDDAADSESDARSRTGGIDSSAHAGPESDIVISVPAALAPLPRNSEGPWKRRGVGIAAAATVLAAAAVVMFVYVHRTEPQPVSAPRLVRQVTYGPSTHLQPSWSPDGGSLAYASDQNGNFDIWVQRLDGSEPQQVTNSGVEEWQPAWSPDGQWLAFRSEERGGGVSIVSLNGGMLRRVSDFGYTPRWSPDGARILFATSPVSHRPRPQYFTVGVDGAQPREVRPDLMNRAFAVTAAWSPDGRVAIWSIQQGHWTFSVAPTDNGTATPFRIADDLAQQVTDLGLEPTSFTWSADGRHLIFDGVAAGIHSLWRVGVDASNHIVHSPLDRLTTGAGTDRDATLSPDGRQVAYSSTSERTRIWSYALDESGRISGEGVPVTLGGSGEFDAAVSADGQKLIYRTTRDGRQELWERSLQDGHERRLITGDEGLRSSPRWSPDGSRLAYQLSVRRPKPGVALAVFAFNEMREQVLTAPGTPTLIPDDWSRDGSLILGPCLTNSSSTLSACVAPAVAQTYMRAVASDPNRNLRSLRFSPDQRWISAVAASRAGSSSITQIVVFPLGGSSSIQITDGTHYDQKPVWGVDGRTVYYLTNSDGFLNVWGRHFDGNSGATAGESFRVTSLNSPRRMIAPDLTRLEIALAARHLYLPVTETSGQVFILRNFDK